MVGAYLIYNTMAISVIQRREEIGALRALGATRRQIVATFLAEGAIFGALGALIGVEFGALLAQFVLGAVQQTVTTLYVGTHADHVIYDPAIVLRAFAFGLGLALLSALVPALEAAATPPSLTLRRQGLERPLTRDAPRLLFAGLGLLALGAAATKLGSVGGVPLFGYIAALLFIVGASLCVPFIVARIATAAPRRIAGLSIAARLAAANLGASARRASVAIAALMVAVGMAGGLAILIDSFRTTVTTWAQEALTADLFVQPLALTDASSDARFSPGAVARIRAVPGVAGVETFTAVSIPFRGEITTLGATDLGSIDRRHRLRLLGGADASALARSLPNSIGLLVSEPFATRFGVRPGDAVPLDTPSGRIRFVVAAEFNDYSSDAGLVIIDQRTFRRLYHDDGVGNLAVYAAQGADLIALRSRIIRAVRPLRIEVETNRELRGVVLTIFDRTFAITSALYLLALTIAILGVVGTLFALVLERRREIGILRYLGLSTGAVRQMILYEAGLIGSLGAALGVALGFAFALLLIYVVNRQSFGWLIDLHVPYVSLLGLVAAIVAAAVVAGLYPARVAARIRTAEALRSE